MTRFVLGIDVGATKIALMTMSEDRDVISRIVISSIADSESELWQRLLEASKTLCDQSTGTLIGIGIGSAGPIDIAQGTVSPVNIPVWRDFPIVALLKKAFNIEHVVLQGDVIALTNAEFELGAGQGESNMLGVAVSTGVGGGLVLNGKLHVGESGNAGYVGHTTVKIEGELCPCGKKGCVEVYSSGPHMVRRAKAMGWGSENGTFETLAQAARDGDEFAQQAIAEGADALAAGIVNAVAVIDINKVVIGGGVSQAGDVFWLPLRRAITQYSEKIEFLRQLDVVPAKLAGEAGVIGAALAAL